MVRMTQQEQAYVQRSFTRHINFHFHENAVASYRAVDIVWIEWNDLCRHEWPEEASILIPIVPKNIVQQATWSVPLGAPLLFFGIGFLFLTVGSVTMRSFPLV